MGLSPSKPSYDILAKEETHKEETQLIIFDEFPALSQISNLPCVLSYLRISEYNELTPALEVTHTTFALEVKRDTIVKFLNKGRLSRFSENHIVGYCNGVFLSSQEHRQDTTLVVINPLKKECYELPPTKNWSGDIGVLVNYSCGLGFDDSTMTFKIVCIVHKKKFDEVTDKFTQDFCTLVHVFGTDSWREIPNPPYSRTMTNEGVFVQGCLHWYAHCPHQVICFDVRKEEFTLIDSPKHIKECIWNNQLVDLHGELGLVNHFNNLTMEVWISKHAEWVLLCKLDRKSPIPDGPVITKVLGCGNKDGEILMTADPAFGDKRLLVYNWKRDDMQQVNFIGRKDGCNSEIRLTRV